MAGITAPGSNPPRGAISFLTMSAKLMLTMATATAASNRPMTERPFEEGPCEEGAWDINDSSCNRRVLAEPKGDKSIRPWPSDVQSMDDEKEAPPSLAR